MLQCLGSLQDIWVKFGQNHVYNCMKKVYALLYTFITCLQRRLNRGLEQLGLNLNLSRSKVNSLYSKIWLYQEANYALCFTLLKVAFEHQNVYSLFQDILCHYIILFYDVSPRLKKLWWYDVTIIHSTGNFVLIILETFSNISLQLLKLKMWDMIQTYL